MLRHTLILIFRNFKRFKSTFFINLIGLSIGLACTLLIYLWITDELNMDKFHANDEKLFQIRLNIPMADGSILTTDGTPGELAQAINEALTDVEEAAVVALPMGGRGVSGILSSGGNLVKANDLYVTDNFFNVFSFKLIHGNRAKVLKEKYAVVITEELALKLFHTTKDIIGKTVEWDRGKLSGSYTISGICANVPVNSTLKFDLLFTYDQYFDKYADNLQNWENSNPMTYVVLKDYTDVNRFSDKLTALWESKVEAVNKEDGRTLFLQRYSDNYLYNRFENGKLAGGRIAYVKLFSIIAVFILAIACINFMNLSTAKASRRIKEIGIKKAIGAGRWALVFQYLAESMLLSFLSLTVAVLLVDVLLPSFNEITGKQLQLHFDSSIVLPFVVITLITGIVSGSYPALYLSGFKPSLILKGKLERSTGESWARKGLVIFQFSISVILIVSVVVVYRQIQFIREKNLGLNKDNIIQIANEGKLRENKTPFLTDVKNLPGVLGATSVAHNLTGEHGSTSAVEWEGKNPEAGIVFVNLEIDYSAIETLGIELIAGRTFSPDFTDERSKIIFNESAIKIMGLTDPVGKKIKLWGVERQIIGVVKDFNFESLYEKVKPCFLQYAVNNRYILVKIRSEYQRQTLAEIHKLYQLHNEGLPFEYKFMDDDYQTLYASEQRVAILARYFAGLAILISCLGLFGLAAFTAERRLKEIGIRKVLGSTELGIIYLLTGDFNKIVFAAVAIALPVSYVVTRFWLENFAYKTELEWWYFTSAGVMALFIAWITVGSQALKAARINPAQCLKDE